ncbi:rRNA maturation RNase YbeY [Bartonella krasnovii]|uniref:rRNA maturation RNase YbeY n=1 Tax=Bartonella krasnovii TaxID=2267275 RepID=UPI001F4C751B|nr:rRNA maturation RNase YbeY [Bartonella krasnovii]UNF38980.1 rRNA maturation RNase YbeY [Bartonella krasnovii]UNF45632.1 rRNA maturation RNase YbeY [Bartonella krasnovii]UNF47219.1 rRNA maturation RNase YbeY [Bartonella krasnovii]UNF48854.1 rRNA maturation RNase YbeY [Bartonella krasnovii]UNF50520.1 rRNA maturation RNase YbeY [Bartonella krasnovii]
MIIIDIMIKSVGWNDEEMLYNITEKALTITMHHVSLENVVSEISLLFTDDEHMAQINAQWRGKNKSTNVLSFPAFPIKAGDPPGPMLGDIIIARETVVLEAEKQGKTFQDHLTHMIVHGILHLLGYDHETDDEAHQMEMLEREILQKLSIRDPYAELSINDKI